MLSEDQAARNCKATASKSSTSQKNFKAMKQQDRKSKPRYTYPKHTVYIRYRLYEVARLVSVVIATITSIAPPPQQYADFLSQHPFRQTIFGQLLYWCVQVKDRKLFPSFIVRDITRALQDRC